MNSSDVINQHLTTVLMASTAHVTKLEGQTGAESGNIGNTLTTMSGEFGWITYLPVDDEPDNTVPEASEGFQKVCAIAREHGISYIHFDGDVPPFSDVVTYEW